MDGARLMNAVIGSGTSAATMLPRRFVWLDFSKGLGAPVGAVLAGTKEFIDRRGGKHLLGGAMRQAGIIAAAGIYAFDYHVDRLAEDHANARLLAEGLAEIPGIELDPATVQTNIVCFDVSGRHDAGDMAGAQGAGRPIGGYGQSRMRAVTHLDVERAGFEGALDAIRAGVVLVLRLGKCRRS